MKPDVVPVNVDDWVYSISPGIWRVYRVIHDVQKLRFGQQERQQTDRRRLIFSKRLVDESWKPAFGNELAVAEFVRVPSDEDRQRLEDFIAKNPKIIHEFEAFRPKALDHAMDLPLNVPASTGKEAVQRLIHNVFPDIGDGLTNDGILQRIAKSELAHYAPKTVRNATLRFICKDHELRDNGYMFREVQLLMV